MSSPRVLLIEDDTRLGSLLVELLRSEGLDADVEVRGDRGLERLLADPPELVLLDVGLPGLDGIEVCRRARAAGYSGPILMLTARGDEPDEVHGLDVGADDYLAKTVTTPRLLARVRALLRRVDSPHAEPRRLLNGGLEVRYPERTVELDGVAVELTTSEFDVLALLARDCGHAVERDRILRALRGREYDGLERSVDVTISRLRKRLGDDPKRPRWIKTVHGVGYLLADNRCDVSSSDSG